MKTAKKMHEDEALLILSEYSSYPDVTLNNVLEACCDYEESVIDLLDSMNFNNVIEIRG